MEKIIKDPIEQKKKAIRALNLKRKRVQLFREIVRANPGIEYKRAQRLVEIGMKENASTTTKT